MRTRCAVLLAAAMLAGAARSAAASEEADLPLPLYQKFKAHFENLYGARAALLPGVPAPKRGETEKSLRADAEANKDALAKALASKSVIHRELAASALEYCGDKKFAVAALSQTLLSDTDESVRRAAAAALAKLPDAAAVDALIQRLSDSTDAVRGICAVALGNIKDNRASEPLLRALRDDGTPIVRMHAATALAKIKDPATLEPLKKAMEDEKDERVKMAIAGAIRNQVGGNAADQMPTPEETSKELASLAREMKEVEAKLRDDHHDQTVQIQGGSIEKKLVSLVEKMEKSSSSSSSGGKQEKQKGNKSEQQQMSGGQSNNGKGGSPLNNSKLGSATPPGAASAAIVSDKQDAWAKLPPAQRDELLQSFRDDVPVRWQKRLQAYFYSLNAEEAKGLDK